MALVNTSLGGARTPFRMFDILTAAHWLISLGLKGYTHHSMQRRPMSRLAKDGVGEYKPRRCQNAVQRNQYPGSSIVLVQFSLQRGMPIIHGNVGLHQGSIRMALVSAGLDGARTPFCTIDILTAAAAFCVIRSHCKGVRLSFKAT